MAVSYTHLNFSKLQRSVSGKWSQYDVLGRKAVSVFLGPELQDCLLYTSIQDMAVSIGLMANAGIKGSQSGTALRSTITRLAKPTAESGAAMEDLGIEITNADGSMKSWAEVVDQMRTGMQKLTADQKASYAAVSYTHLDVYKRQER